MFYTLFEPLKTYLSRTSQTISIGVSFQNNLPSVSAINVLIDASQVTFTVVRFTSAVPVGSSWDWKLDLSG